MADSASPIHARTRLPRIQYLYAGFACGASMHRLCGEPSLTSRCRMSVTLFLQASPLALIITSVVLGLVVGSFLNVVVHRLPIMLEREWQAQAAELSGTAPPQTEKYNLVVPRSRCPHCGHSIT